MHKSLLILAALLFTSSLSIDAEIPKGNSISYSPSGHSSFLSFSGPPNVHRDHRDRYVAKEGDTVRMACPATGNPRPIVEWYSDDGRRINQRFNARFKPGRTLRIREVKVADSGTYVCKAVNGFGSRSVAISLIVRGTFLRSNESFFNFFLPLWGI